MFLLSRRWIDTRSPQLATWFYCSLNTQKILGRVEPASIWQLERLRAMVRVDSPTEALHSGLQPMLLGSAIP